MPVDHKLIEARNHVALLQLKLAKKLRAADPDDPAAKRLEETAKAALRGEEVAVRLEGE